MPNTIFQVNLNIEQRLPSTARTTAALPFSWAFPFSFF